MKIYYLQAEYQPGKHRIVAIYDSDAFKFDEGVLSPFNILVIDEIAPANKPLCLDLSRTINRTDVNGDSKYYVDGLGALMQVADWTEYIPVRI